MPDNNPKPHWLDGKKERLEADIASLAETLEGLRLQLTESVTQRKINLVSDAAQRMSRICGAIMGMAHEHRTVSWVDKHPEFERSISPRLLADWKRKMFALLEAVKSGSKSGIAKALEDIRTLTK